MRQSCLKALLPLAGLTMACHESIAPPKQPALFVLETLNNQPLPAIIGAGGGDTTTLLFASLFLDGAASARIITQTHQVSVSNPPRDVTDTARYSYRIVGDSVAFASSTPCGLCPLPPFGRVTSSTMTLFYGGSPSSRSIYFYRAIELMPAL